MTADADTLDDSNGDNLLFLPIEQLIFKRRTAAIKC
jgi:hypothetical protein